MKKLPYGISNYEEMVQDNYYYVDKTKYIEQLENLSEKRIMFLRPRKFGKTLFTSVLENYYDVNKKDRFKKLFKNTYIGKHPTKSKNSYYILRFNFSGIDTADIDKTLSSFKSKTSESIKFFIEENNLDFYINSEQEPEELLNSLIKAFRLQKPGRKLYVIIDEYDHFANELLGFDTENFKTLVSKNGKIRKWYEVLKEGTETVVDRIFITGVAPITLDSLTSGFNIGSDITMDKEFNEMMGFTQEELKTMMKEQEIKEETQKELLPIMKEHYDGYKFSTYSNIKVYNSNMCLYFLNQYRKIGYIPENLIDVNIASDYNKIAKMLDLCKGENRLEIIKKSLTEEGILTQIRQSFNPEMDFTEEDLVSMLFYLGYLTIAEGTASFCKLNIPNTVMKELYSEYFLKILEKQMKVKDNIKTTEISSEMIFEGRIDKLVELMRIYLNNLSNRDYQKFDEKYIKIIFYTLAMNLNVYRVKSELEVNRKYPDLLLMPKDKSRGYHSIMIEFKYLKKNEETQLEDKKKEAKKQIEEYSQFEEIKEIDKLKKYTIIAVNDKLYVDEIK